MARQEINPYAPGMPVKSPHFVGREKEIAEIQGMRRNAGEGYPACIFVEGDWGVGKTSLIWKIKPVFKEHGLVIDHDVVRGSASAQSRAFFTYAFQVLAEKAVTSPKFVLDVDTSQASKMCKTLTNFLTTLWSNKDGQLAIFILDDVEKAEPDFLAVLKNVFQRVGEVAPHFMLILSGKTLPGAGEQASDPIARFFKTVPVGPLSREDSIAAINKPIEYDNEFKIEQQAAELIAERSAGHPYFLKQICYDVYSFAGGKGTIDLAWIEDRWPEVEKLLVKNRFFKEFDKCPESEQHVLRHASVAGVEFARSNIKGLKPATLDTALRRLRESGLIKASARGVYRFYHPLFWTYIRAQAMAAGIEASAATRPETAQPSVEELITRGESHHLEFKETLQFNVETGMKDKTMLTNVLKSIVAFGNADGGILLIGVADDGKIVGLERDLNLLDGRRRTRDGLGLLIANQARDQIEPKRTGRVGVRFEATKHGDVCIVSVPRQNEIANMKGSTAIIVRDNAKSQSITEFQEIMAFKERWMRRRE